MFKHTNQQENKTMSKPTYKFIIKSSGKIHSFKTLKLAKEFAGYIGGLVIIARVRA